MFTNDASGYYLYLPAAFIYHDIGYLQFHTEISKKYFPNDDDKWYVFKQEKTGKILDKYAIGVSLFELPTFWAAHLYCRITGKNADDGYSAPYQLAGIFSNIIWVIAGLFVLRKFLSGYFNDTVVALTLVCIALGTNLYHYTEFDHGLSHPYLFFLFSYVLYVTDNWYKSKKYTYLYLIAIGLGLVAIARPIDIVIAALPLLWQINRFKNFNSVFNQIKLHFTNIIIAFALFILVISIQLTYWKYITGHWVFFSYEHEVFNFLHPNIFKGLFSYRKGWFVYTPIAFIGICGMYSLYKKDKSFFYALTVFFVVMIYAVFSWRNWWYGGSFGCRALIESLAVVALPLASLIEQVLKSKLILKMITFLILLFCTVLNIFQSYQFSLHIIHYDRMSKAYYWHTFGKLKINPAEYEKYLMSEKEYWQNMSEIDK